jgi:hypothetical protein
MKNHRFVLITLFLGIAVGVVLHDYHPETTAPSPGAARLVQPVAPPSPAPGVVQPAVPEAPVASASDTLLSQAIAPGIADVMQQKLAAWRLAADLNEKFKLLEEMRALITDSNAPEIAKSLSDEDLAGQVGIEAMQHWLESNLTNAAEWMASRSGTTDSQASLVTHFMMADSQGLQNYLASLPADGTWRNQMLSAAGLEMAANDPQQAIAFASEMESSDGKSVFLVSAASEWALIDSTSAMDWAAKQEDPALREEVITAVAKSRATTDPAGAANWIASSITDPQLIGEAMQSIIPKWMANDPNAAADWVRGGAPGALRDSSLESLLSYWYALNSDAAIDWLSQLSDADMQEKGVAVLRRAAYNSP